MQIRKQVLISTLIGMILTLSIFKAAPIKASAPTLTMVWQTKFKGDAVLSDPADIAVDKSGNTYVSTQSNNHIKKFDPNGNFVLQWGDNGKGEGQFQLAFGVAVDPDDNVYVTDFYNLRLQKFDSNGKFLKQWATEPSTSPAFISIDAKGTVYVDEFPPHDNHFVQKFDQTGKLISEWGDQDKRFGGRIEDMALDHDGNLYVVDASANRVQKLDPNGKVLATLGGKASTEGQGNFSGPGGITVDKDGNVYVIDNNFLQKFDWEGKFITQWSTKGGDLDKAANITVDAEGNLYVLAMADVVGVNGSTLNVFVLKKFSQS